MPTTDDLMESAFRAWSLSTEDEVQIPESFAWAFRAGAAVARKEALREAEAAALGPSVSGVLHDASTARDIALAIGALADRKS